MKDLVISCIHNSFKYQRVLTFKIGDQVWLRAYLSDIGRPILRAYVVEKIIENQNIEQDQQVKEDIFNDKLDDVNMSIADDDESGDEVNVKEDRTPTPVAVSNIMDSSQST